VALTVVCVALLALAGPQLGRGFPAAHDAMAHVTYTFAFDRALHQGQFPVRWIDLVRRGDNQPLFTYYEPGLYYLVELVHLAVPSLALSLRLTVLLAWWGTACFVWLIAAPLGRMPAALAALLAAYSPYLLLDVFVRAAYPELAGIACGAGALWALEAYIRRRRQRHLIALAMLLGLLLICHPPAALIFGGPIALRFAAWVWQDRPRLSVAAGPVISAVIGTGVSAFYLAPALLERSFVKAGELVRGYFDYRDHFVYPRQWLDYHWGYGGSVPGPHDQMSFQIGVLQWLAIAAAAAVVVASIRHRTRARQRGILLFWLTVAGATMYLTIGASSVLWDRLAALAYVQFPWRWLMIPTVACAMLGAVVLACVRRASLQAALLVTLTAAQVALAWVALTPPRYFDAQATDIDNPSWPMTSAARAQAFVEDGYFPRDSRRPPNEPAIWSQEGSGVVRPVAATDDALRFSTASDDGLCLTLATHAFPGWTAWIDGREANVETTMPYGYLAIAVPPGVHRVDLALISSAAPIGRPSAASSRWGCGRRGGPGSVCGRGWPDDLDVVQGLEVAVVDRRGNHVAHLDRGQDVRVADPVAHGHRVHPARHVLVGDAERLGRGIQAFDGAPKDMGHLGGCGGCRCGRGRRRRCTSAASGRGDQEERTQGGGEAEGADGHETDHPRMVPDPRDISTGVRPASTATTIAGRRMRGSSRVPHTALIRAITDAQATSRRAWLDRGCDAATTSPSSAASSTGHPMGEGCASHVARASPRPASWPAGGVIATASPPKAARSAMTVAADTAITRTPPPSRARLMGPPAIHNRPRNTADSRLAAATMATISSGTNRPRTASRVPTANATTSSMSEGVSHPCVKLAMRLTATTPVARYADVSSDPSCLAINQTLPSAATVVRRRSIEKATRSLAPAAMAASSNDGNSTRF
jgi:hypothetical protein